MINCKIELDLTWARPCVISEMLRTPEVVAHPNANEPIVHAHETETTEVSFKINIAKVYSLVVTLPIKDNLNTTFETRV